MYYYSPILSRFVRALTVTFPYSEAFCFHIQLHRRTDLIRERRAEKVVESFEKRQGLWFGRTKCSKSLLYLINEYGSKFHSSKTSVLIFSDAFDTMSAEELVLWLKRIKEMVRHIYWIDPNHTRRMETGSDKEGPMHAASQWYRCGVSWRYIRWISKTCEGYG